MSAHGLLVRAQLFFVAPTGAQQLYYLHPDVSFFKGNGFKQIGPYLDMPDNSAAGDVSLFLQIDSADIFCTSRGAIVWRCAGKG